MRESDGIKNENTIVHADENLLENTLPYTKKEWQSGFA